MRARLAGGGPHPGRYIACALLGLFLVSASFASAEGRAVVINEFLASNGAVLADENGDYEDWIELYNRATAPVNLAGYTLTDKRDNPGRWTMPDVTIQPGGFLLIWASGKARRTPGTWNLGRPLVVEFESGGYYDGDFASISVNGEDRSSNLRGINIVRLDEEGDYVESKTFDTWESPDAADSLVCYIESLSRGEIVILAVRDEASDNLNSRARSALQALGSEYIGQLEYWDSWGMISVVGQGKLAEAYRPSGEGPARARLASKMTLHANFKIDKDGEYLGLYAPDGTEIDSLSFEGQARDVSFGRQPDGGEDWCLFSQPTPNGPNDTSCAAGIAEPPGASVSGGFYEGPITIALTAAGGAEIRFTLDGSTPTEASPRYVEPLMIEETKVVRARAFQEGLIPSQTVTHTYFIGEDVHLAALSLVTDPANLWNEEIGIYTVGLDPAHPNFEQRGPKWERPVHLEFYEEDCSLSFAQGAGIRIFGGTTRGYPKKSFILHFREKYGHDTLDYPIFWEAEFDKHDLDSFKSLVVRNAGNDGVGSLPRIRDPLMHALWLEEGGLVSAKRSVFVYLNGEPWGIYNLREHIDKHYLRSNCGAEEADLLEETRTIEEGDIAHWDSTLSFFRDHDLKLTDNFEHAQGLIDITNFTDYELFQIYAGNIDLVDANWIRFRPRTPDGKWKWIMWDMDFAFGLTTYNPVSHNTLAWETRDRPRPDLGPPWDDGGETLYATIMLRKLLRNEEYRDYLVNRFADLLNTTLHPGHVHAMIDALVSIIEPDIPLEMARWSAEWGGSVEEWLDNVGELRDFAQQRPTFVRQQIGGRFGLKGTASLTIESPSGEGYIWVNTIMPSSHPWHGTYFQDVPVKLRAEPAPGYQFTSWSDPSLPKAPSVTVLLPEYYSITALFSPARE